MTVNDLDATDWRLLEALQQNGRASFTELARMVAMSPSAVTERVRRLEEAGVIAGYAAVVDTERVGLPILAFIRLRYPTSNYKPFHDLIGVTPEIIEAHHVTGEDCFMLKVAARSMRHLESVAGRVAGLGSVTTTIVYSSPLPRRPIRSTSQAVPE
ncbi:MAG TPA: Lrp/AsnC family transcriptional regulator [Jiangellaceae bacterium]